MGGSHRPGQLNSSASSSKLADGCGLRWGWFKVLHGPFFGQCSPSNLDDFSFLIWICFNYEFLNDVYFMIWIFWLFFFLWYGYFLTWFSSQTTGVLCPSFAFHLACCTNAQLLSCYGTDVAQLFGMCRPHGAKHVAFQACNTQSFVCRGVNA